MKKSLCLVICLCCAYAGWAQKDAVVKASTLVETPPGEIAYNDGVSFLEQKNYSDAVTKFSESIELMPDFVEAYYNRAVANNALGETQKAIEDLTHAIEIQPSLNMYFTRGRIQQDLGHAGEAEEDFTKVITSHTGEKAAPFYVESYYYRGAIYFADDDLEKAIYDYTQCVAANPAYAYAYNDRGSAYRKQELYDKAIADYTSAITVDPSIDFFYTNRGSAYRLKKEFDNAITDYTKALSLATDNKALILNNRGLAKMGKADWANAQGDFLEAQKFDPTYIHAYNNLGNVFYRQKEYEKAIAQYGKVLERNPNFGQAYLNRGISKEYTRDDKGSCADWKKAASLEIKIAESYFSQQCK